MSRQATDCQVAHSRQLFFRAMRLCRLPLLFTIALCLTLALATGNVTAERLFQSPQSPPAQPPPAEPPPAPQPPAEQPPAPQPPPAEQPAVPQAPTEQQPVAQPPAGQPPTEQPPAGQAPIAPPPSAEQPPLALPPIPQPATQQVPAVTKEEPPTKDKDNSPNLTLDTAELIDTVVVSGAYIWFCCGVILLPLIPIGLLLLYIRGRSKIIQEEDF
jgi:hypothetical protein